MTKLRTLVLGSSGIKSWKGKGGLFACPIKAVNNLEAIPTTSTSTNPVSAAKGMS